MKTLSNHWVVGKMSNSREFYITIGKKETNLVEVSGMYMLYCMHRYLLGSFCYILFSDEVKKICEKQLESIFFHV